MQIENFTTCIFDFDGVIIDSEPLHAEAKRLTLKHFQIQLSEDTLLAFKGRPDADFFAHIAAEYTAGSPSAQEMDTYKRQQYLQLFEAVPLVPGALEFLGRMRAKFQRLGLVTSATARDLSLALKKFQLEGWFDIIVIGEDTLQHKPSPEPYLLALKRLGAAPAETLVIEDSPNGIHAAKAAGCAVAAITTTFSAEELVTTQADLIGGTFPELQRALKID